MTKRQLIVQSHLRNEGFLRELQPIIALWITFGLFKAYGLDTTTNEGPQDHQARWEKIRAEVGLLKELVDRLEVLTEAWPNAVWLLFPETGHGGRIRLCREFHTEVYPVCFPDAPRAVSWRARRIRGHRWCGISRRIRKETHRTFRMWDQFEAGRSPMKIARREFPSKSPQQTRTWKKELMAVHRSLERASQLIYEQPLPRNRKARRLLDFSSDDHLAMCAQCRNATTLDQLCAPARDFANQDQQYQRELPLPD
jgi:hypothetical protein